MTRIVLLGSSSLLANFLASELRTDFEIQLVGRSAPLVKDLEHNWIKCTNVVELPRKVKTLIVNADIVINCIAMTSVDRCEFNRDAAYAINTRFPKLLVDFVSQTSPSTYLMCFSTDQVYASRDKAIDASVPADPCNWYGKTKLMGEPALEQDNALTVRLNYVNDCPSWHAADRRISVFKNLLSAGGPFYAACDWFFAPIGLRDVSLAVKAAVVRKISGRILLGGEQLLSKFDYYSSLSGSLGFNGSLVKTAVLSDLNLKAERPKSVFLDFSETKGLLGLPAEWPKEIFEDNYV